MEASNGAADVSAPTNRAQREIRDRQKEVLQKAGIKLEDDELSVRAAGNWRWFIATKKGYANMREIEAGERFLFDGQPSQWCHPEGEEPPKKINVDAALDAMSRGQASAPAGTDPSLKLLLEANAREMASFAKALEETRENSARLAEGIAQRDAAIERITEERNALAAKLEDLEKRGAQGGNLRK